MPAPEFEPQLKNHLAVVRHRWWVVVAGALIAGGGVWLWQDRTPDRYEATAVIRISYSEPVADGGDITDFQARSYAELATSPSVVASAIESSGLELDLDEAESRLDVGLRSTPGFVEIEGTGPTAEDARLLVASVATELVARVSEDQTVAPVDGEALASVDAQIVAPARADDRSASPHPARAATLAAIVAAILGAEGSVLVWHLQGRLSLADPLAQIEAATGIRVVDLTGRRPDSLLPLFAGHLDRRLVLTVAQRGSVPTAQVAIQLARAVRKVEGHVLVVDADTGSPVRHLSIGSDPPRSWHPELGDGEGTRILAGQVTPIGTRATIVRYEPTSDGGGDTRLARTNQLVRSAGTSTVVSVTAASGQDDFLSVVTSFPENVVLVIDPGKTRLEALVRMCADVAELGGRVAGVVLSPDPKRPQKLSEVTVA